MNLQRTVRFSSLYWISLFPEPCYMLQHPVRCQPQPSFPKASLATSSMTLCARHPDPSQRCPNTALRFHIHFPSAFVSASPSAISYLLEKMLVDFKSLKQGRTLGSFWASLFFVAQWKVAWSIPASGPHLQIEKDNNHVTWYLWK